MANLSERGRAALKRMMVLAAVSVLAVGLLRVLFTDLGVGLLFRLGVYMTSSEVNPIDSAYLEYYDAKERAAEADGVRVYIQRDDPSGWKAALDFLKFIKQNADLSELRMVISSDDADAVNIYLSDGDSTMLDGTALSDTELGFIRELSAYNAKLPPQKRVRVAPLVGSSDESGLYSIYYEIYSPDRADSRFLDVSVVYHEAAEDPLFDIPIREGALRFGSTEKLLPYTQRLEAVSGNCGREPFAGLQQAEFYFIVGAAAEDEEE